MTCERATDQLAGRNTDIRVRHDRRGAVLVSGELVQVTGEICLANVGLLQDALVETHNYAPACTIDLTGVTYIDCAGLRAIATHAYRHPVLRVTEGSVVERVVELFGLGRLARSGRA